MRLHHLPLETGSLFRSELLEKREWENCTSGHFCGPDILSCRAQERQESWKKNRSASLRAHSWIHLLAEPHYLPGINAKPAFCWQVEWKSNVLVQPKGLWSGKLWHEQDCGLLPFLRTTTSRDHLGRKKAIAEANIACTINRLRSLTPTREALRSQRVSVQGTKLKNRGCRVLRCVLLQAVWDLKRNEPPGRAAKTASLISSKEIARDPLRRKSSETSFNALERSSTLINPPKDPPQDPSPKELFPAFASSNKCKAHVQGTPFWPRLQAPQTISISVWDSDPAYPAYPVWDWR